MGTKNIKQNPWVLGITRGEMMIDFLKKEVGPLKEKNVLDIGAGPGGISIAFSKECKNVVAIEPNREYSSMIKNRISEMKLENITLLEDSFLNINLPESSFDIAILNGVLEWVGVNTNNPKEIQKEVLKKVFSLLKEDGVLYIGIENRWFPLNFLKDPHIGLPFVAILPRKIANIVSQICRGKIYDTPIYSYWELTNIIKKVGFSKVKIYMPVVNYQYPAVFVDINERKNLTKDEVREIYNKYKNIGIHSGLGIKIFYCKNVLKLGLSKLLSKSFVILAYKKSLLDKNRILIIADSILKDDRGGAERVIDEYTQGLVKKNYNVSILVPLRKNNLAKEEIDGGVKIYRFGQLKKTGMINVLYTLIDGIKTISKISKTEKFDLIIINQPFSGIVSYLSSITRKIPKLYFFHSPWPEEYMISKHRKGFGYEVRKIIEKLVLSGCDKIICYSNFMKNKIISIHGVPEEKIKFITVGVDTQKFAFGDKNIVRSQLNLPKEKFIIFTARRLVPRMGIENLLYAIQKLIADYDNILLVIAGSGPLEYKLKKICSELNINSYVKFVGMLDDNTLPLYYRAADIFVLPTKYLEGFGLVTLESLASGTPVLATPVGGTVEILKKFDESMLFKGTKPEDIYEGIKSLISNPDKLLQIKNKCRDFILNNYSRDVFISEFISTIKDFLTDEKV